jgi:hypothetical protein
MEIYHWIGGHGFDLLEGVGIIASLTFAGLAFRREEKARHTANLLAITAAHRAIWSELFRQPKLARVLDPEADLAAQPVTTEESFFVTFLILHLNVTFKASVRRMFATPEALTRDMRQFFSLPIPKAVWEQSRPLQDGTFVAFVENALNSSKVDS